MQRGEGWILAQARHVVANIFRTRLAHHTAKIQKLCAYLTVIRHSDQPSLHFVFSDVPGIHVLSRCNSIDRKKWFALVFQRRSYWSLKQTIERQQILHARLRAGLLVQLLQRAERSNRLRMSLLLVEFLKNLSDLKELG